MKRLFRKGERVRSADGKVMEVLNYMNDRLVEVQWFDLESKEVHKNIIRQNRLSRAV
jgi:uncharacterized protein YodC (DUF2158 family)